MRNRGSNDNNSNYNSGRHSGGQRPRRQGDNSGNQWKGGPRKFKGNPYSRPNNRRPSRSQNRNDFQNYGNQSSISNFAPMPDTFNQLPEEHVDAEFNAPAGNNDFDGDSKEHDKQRRSLKNARRALSSLEQIPPEELTEKNKRDMKWAKKKISEYSEVSQAEEQLVQQLPEMSSKKDGKRQTVPIQPLQMQSNKVETGDKLVWAVIDSSKNDGKITPANWKTVELALLKVYKDVVLANPGPSPVCRDGGWYQCNIKLIECADQRSAELYKLAVDQLGEIWPGAKLKVVTIDQIPNRPRAKVYLPLEPSTPEEILSLLQLSNFDIPTHDWAILKIGHPNKNGLKVTIVINEASLAPLEARKGLLNYGFGSITLRVYKSDKACDVKKEPEWNYVETTLANIETNLPEELEDSDSDSDSDTDSEDVSNKPEEKGLPNASPAQSQKSGQGKIWCRSFN